MKVVVQREYCFARLAFKIKVDVQREYRSEGRSTFRKILIENKGRRSARVLSRMFSEIIGQNKGRYSARLAFRIKIDVQQEDWPE